MIEVPVNAPRPEQIPEAWRIDGEFTWYDLPDSQQLLATSLLSAALRESLKTLAGIMSTDQWDEFISLQAESTVFHIDADGTIFAVHLTEPVR